MVLHASSQSCEGLAILLREEQQRWTRVKAVAVHAVTTEVLRAHPASNSVILFQQSHFKTCARQTTSHGQASNARAHNHRSPAIRRRPAHGWRKRSTAGDGGRRYWWRGTEEVTGGLGDYASTTSATPALRPRPPQQWCHSHGHCRSRTCCQGGGCVEGAMGWAKPDAVISGRPWGSGSCCNGDTCCATCAAARRMWCQLPRRGGRHLNCQGRRHAAQPNWKLERPI
mmetsp:Transcript_24503/g.61291  ORF Transcript_24503/g.61291 Transcript_24503/m.61291 type:complete len:227 (-) Transcript_24503:8-688(-)